MKQIPSLANLNMLDFGSRVKELAEAGVNMFHIDLMDGHYVPSLCLPPRTVKDLKDRYPECVAEVHMMVDNPMDYIGLMKEAGADYLSFHADSTPFVRRTLTAIKEAGMKAGIVLNPSQPVLSVEPFADQMDYMVFMSVEPGYAGQRFLPGSMERLKKLTEFRKQQKLEFEIIIDGGVDYENLPGLMEAGADAVVSGIYLVFEQPDGIAGACRRFDQRVREIENELQKGGKG